VEERDMDLRKRGERGSFQLRHLVALLALSVLAACGAGATGAARAPAPVQFKMRDFHLRSGMRIVVEEDHSAPVVGVVTVVGAGSTDDPPGKEGLAHLVEHLTFRAKPAPAQNLWSLFDQAGATDVNGVTSWDYTLYEEFGAADTLHDLLTLEGLRLVDPLAKLDDATFDVEREVVRNELRERGETNVAGAVYGALQGAAFPSSHPYARPVGGTHQSLSSLTLDDARGFARDHYKPANVTLLVIGDVKLDRMEQLFASSLSSTLSDPVPGAVAAGPRLPAQAPEVPPPPRQEAIEAIEGHVAAPELYIAWPLPRAFAEGSYLGVLALTGTRAALELADYHDPDIVGTAASISGGVQASLLVGRVVLREGADPKRSLTHVLDELYRNWALADHPWEQGLVQDVRFSHQRMRLVTGTMVDAQDIRARAVERAEFAHFAGDVTVYSKNMAALAQVDREQLAKFYETYLNRDRARAVLVRPKSDARGSGAARSGLREVHDQARVTYDLASIPGIARPLGVGSTFQHEVLDNGLVVDSARRGTMPVVAVGISFRGGVAEEKKPGAAEFALLGAVPSQMKGHLEDVGAWMQRSATSDELTFRVYVLAQYLGYALDVLADHVQSLRVHEDAIRELERSYFPYAQKARAMPERVADREFRKALFGSLPFATTGELPEEGHPSAGDANDWLETVLTPGHAVLAIVGDVDPGEATRLAKSAFGGWSGSSPPPRTEDGEQTGYGPPALAGAGKRAAIVVARPDATQSEVRIACRLAPARAAEALRYQVLARAVDARLNGSIRQAMGYSYGFHAHVETLLGGSAVLYLRGSIENAGLLPALQAVRQVLGGNAGLTSSDLDAGRWAVARGYDMALATPATWLSRALEVERRGWGLDAVDAEPKLLASFDSTGLVESLRRCAKEGVISIVGDEPTARYALAKAWP
jgi:zinc protease